MKTTSKLVFLAICLAALLPRLAHAQAFTYQGELTQAGLPANDAADLEFRVFQSSAGGPQIGSTFAAVGVVLNGGRFSVEVDPGAGVFNGAERWVEIAVRPSGGGSYVTLTPRQKVAATPYASKALAEWLVPVSAGVLSIDPSRNRLFLNRSAPLTSAEYFGIRTPTIGTDYGGMYVETESSNGRPFSGLAAGGRRVWTYLDGTTGQWRLNVLGQDRMVVTELGLVGINATNPAAMLDVGGTVRGVEFQYATPKTHYLSIPSGGFQPTSNHASATIESAGSGTYFASTVALAAFAVPLDLPDGAVITQIDIAVFDNAAGTMNGRLLVRPFGGFGYGFTAATPGSANSGAMQTLTMSPNVTVNNFANSYLLMVESNDWSGSTSSIFGARVSFTVTTPD